MNQLKYKKIINMKLKFLSITLFLFSLNYAQNIEYKILNSKLDEKNKIILEIVLSNRTNVNYVINKNFTFENKNSHLI